MSKDLRTLLKRFPDNLPPHWREKLSTIPKEAFFKDLIIFLESEYSSKKIIYPKTENIFRALETTDLPEVKVVILGQDPYHGEGQAIGYSFAVPNDLKPKPPSLKNIFKELKSDLAVSLAEGHSDLSGWAGQGVLLLNTVLTVEANKPLSHRKKGWEEFTHQVLKVLVQRKDPVVFMLLGGHAQKMKDKLDLGGHAVIESAHPSPLAAHRGFMGSRVFSKANLLLTSMGKTPIHWDRLSIHK